MAVGAADWPTWAIRAPAPATAARGLERRAAEQVEHERRRRAVDRRREPLLEVVAVERDGRVGSERSATASSRSLVAPDRDDPARAEQLRDLNGDRADAARRAEHEHASPGRTGASHESDIQAARPT